MENVVFQAMTEFLLRHCFRNKKDLARKIGISYRTFLNCCSGKGTHRAINDASSKLLRYCIENKIALDDAIILPL